MAQRPALRSRSLGSSALASAFSSELFLTFGPELTYFCGAPALIFTYLALTGAESVNVDACGKGFR